MAHIIDESDIGATTPAAPDDDSKVARAKDATQEVAAKAQDMAAPAKEKAKDVAGQAKDHAQSAAEQARHKAAAQVDERSTQVGQQIDSQAESIGGVAEELRRQGQDGPAKIAEQVGEKVKGVADYLQEADGERLVAAAGDLARENPAAAAAAGAAAGFVAGRVIKASSPDDPSEQQAPEAPAVADGG